MLYDLIAFFFLRDSDRAFAICVHATKYMDYKQLRDTGDYFRELARQRADREWKAAVNRE